QRGPSRCEPPRHAGAVPRGPGAGRHPGPPVRRARRRQGVGRSSPGTSAAPDEPGAPARALGADRPRRSRRVDARAGRVIQQHGDSAGNTLWLVTSRGLALCLIVLAVAVWNQSAPLAALVALLLALAVVTRVWSLLALHSVRCTLTFRDDRAFPDDEIALVLRVAGRTPIPIPWLEVDFVLPRGVDATPEPRGA